MYLVLLHQMLLTAGAELNVWKIRYHTIRQKGLMWTQKLSVLSQLNLAHVTIDKKY